MTLTHIRCVHCGCKKIEGYRTYGSAPPMGTSQQRRHGLREIMREVLSFSSVERDSPEELAAPGEGLRPAGLLRRRQKPDVCRR